MRIRTWLAFMLGSLIAVAVVANAPPRAAAQGDAGEIERGRYIVQRVGMCVNCHGAGLRGSKLDFLAPGLPVARTAPRIAGLPQLSFAQGVTFIESGLLPNGKTARPPMPQYRMHHDDAAAVVAYLKSLR
jgi:mono/diheme cytochrome c family protein